MPCRGATPRDYRVLPKKIFLVRHAESEVRGAAARMVSELRLQAHERLQQEAMVSAVFTFAGSGLKCSGSVDTFAYVFSRISSASHVL